MFMQAAQEGLAFGVKWGLVVFFILTALWATTLAANIIMYLQRRLKNYEVKKLTTEALATATKFETVLKEENKKISDQQAFTNINKVMRGFPDDEN
jgi:hypothetical protein